MAPLLTGTYGARCAADLLEVLRSDAAARCDLIELRLDLPSDAAPHIEDLVRASPRPVLATCRAQSGLGGAARTDRLLRAVAAGAEWVDVEDDADPRDVERVAASSVKILRSIHVEHLPASDADAAALVARLLAPPATAAKLVALKGGADDAARILRLVRANAGRLAAHIVPVRFTRPASAALGAPIVYAAIRAGTGLNLRLPTVRWMLDVARFRRLAAGSTPFLLLGGDVEGSVSPDMLNAAFEDTGPDLVSLRWSCDEPEAALRAILEFGWAGAAVTMPHKERALDLVRDGMGRVADTAERVGALNTVIREGDSLVAHNTDLGGILDAVAPHLPAEGVRGRAALILGAGGAARAAHAAMLDLGATPVVWARTPERARAFGAAVVGTRDEALALDPAIIINATPAGADGRDAAIDLPDLQPGTVVVEMIVALACTAILRAADQPGVRRVPGFATLVCQAERQVRLLGGAMPVRDGLIFHGSRAMDVRAGPILLVGLRCSGKSTIAPLLADLLARGTGRTWVDTDDLVRAAAGQTPDEMIAAGDEAEFRRIENDVLSRAVSGPGLVIACGGGACLLPSFPRARGAATKICLDARDDVLLSRWAASPRAPLTALAPAAELARQRAERSEMYRMCADACFDTSDAAPEIVAERIADWLETRADRA